MQLEPLTGYALQTEHLRLALRSGDRQRAAMALWLEAPVRAMRGSRGVAYTRRTLAAARAMTAGLDETLVPAAVLRTVEGIVALFEGRWVDGLDHRAPRSAPNTSFVGHSSLRGTVYATRAMNLFWMGRSGELLRELPSQVRDMEDHGNLYGWLWLKLLEAWALSCSGDMDAAWATSELVRSRIPAGVFQLHRWYLEFGQVKFLLLQGEVEEAWRRLEAVNRQTRFAMLGQLQRCPVYGYAPTSRSRGRRRLPATRGDMLAESRRLVRRMERERVPWADAIAGSVRASTRRSPVGATKRSGSSERRSRGSRRITWSRCWRSFASIEAAGSVATRGAPRWSSPRRGWPSSGWRRR